MPFALTIAGVDRTAWLRAGSLRVHDALNQRSTAAFHLLNPPAAPAIGQAVEIRDETGALIFGGQIDEPGRSRQVAGSPAHYAVQAVDHHSLADRRIVAEAYDGLTAGAIVQALITGYLAAEGITAGTIQAGPTVTRAVFNYLTAARALDELSELSGYQWVIRPTKALDFFARATFTAPWTADESASGHLLAGTVAVIQDRQTYRNRQYLRAGTDLTDPRTESFAGDGTRQAFTLAYPVAKVPSVTVNGAAKTVGIRGLETGKDWFWNKGDAVISQDDAAARLTTAQTLAVTYQGLFPIIVQADDYPARGERSAVEGGTGIYEQIEQDASIDDADAALEYARGKLRRYARIATTLTYETRRTDLRVGQLQTVALPSWGASGTYLISQIETSERPGATAAGRRRVTALDGEAVGGWVSFFRRLAAAGQAVVLRDNEVLIKLQQLQDGVTLADSLATPVTTTPENRAGFALAGYAEAG